MSEMYRNFQKKHNLSSILLQQGLWI